MTNWQEEILKKWNQSTKQSATPFKDAIRDRLAREFKGEILYKEPMDLHTSMRVGGKADVFLRPRDLNDLIAVLTIAREEDIPFLVLGSGTNVLVKDGGIRGFVIQLSSALHDCKLVSENNGTQDIYVEAGVKISAFVNFATEHSLSGIEALIGIPGTMGGALFMNAGARGVEIQNIVRDITTLSVEGEIRTIPREKLDYSYRYLKLPRSQVIISGVFRLQSGQPEEIAACVKEFQKKRVATQPLNYPNMGSIFKNPQPLKKGAVSPSAGALIEETGLKDIRVGGARISDKHANFIVNENNAKAKDVLVLINLIKDKVKEKAGILLETEIKIVGEDE